ncbi:MAG: choice-of-anchor A family protein [Clostridia bacterium]|nr:choice-of-anchor A family protein [Clostridia bacterium]
MSMKKMLSLLLAAAISVSVFCLSANAHTAHVNPGDTLKFNGASSENAFGDLLDWNGIIFGNVNNLIDLEGTLAVSGNFNSTTGFSVNSGAYGQDPASTDDVAFLAGGNVNISGYGNVWGQTVIGNEEGNTYHLSNVTASETTNGQYTAADAAQYFADAKTTADAVKAAVSALAVNGAYESAYGTYTFAGDPDADVLVYEVSDAVISSYLFDFTIADGQTVVLNLTAPEKIEFKYGANQINGSTDPDYLRKYNRNIIINVENAKEIEMTSTELYGILLAPEAELKGSGSNVCGTSILKGLTGSNGFELHIGYNNSFVPAISIPTDPDDETTEENGENNNVNDPETVGIRIDVPLKMAVAFADGTVYYGGEMKDVVYGQEYMFRMCAVNWENGQYDENGNGLAGTVVYRMTVVHRDEFFEYAAAASSDPDRYVVKGIDIIDNETKTIIINGDAADAHLETDVNSFFVAYRFHFTSSDYNKKTGIANVINTPLESLSVNLPVGSTVACSAYKGDELLGAENVFITRNSGEGVYDDVLLTSVNDYTWAY